MTCVRELVEIIGIRDHDRRMQGLNLSGGPTNAVEFCTTIYKHPTLVELRELYKKKMAIEA